MSAADLAILHDGAGVVRAIRGPQWDRDEASERAVLAAGFNDWEVIGDAWERVAGLISPEHFANPVHAVIFAAMTAVRARGEHLNVVSVAAQLRSMERLESVGGAQYLGEITDYLPGPTALDTHALRVREHHTRRTIVEEARIAARNAMTLSKPVGASLADATSRLLAIPVPGLATPSLGADFDEYTPGPDAVPEVIVPTGIRVLDGMLQGGLRAQSILVVGQPGTGKTTLAVQIALDVVASTGPVYLWSREQDRREVRDIAIANRARLPFSIVRGLRERKIPMTHALREQLMPAVNAVSNPDLRVDDESTPGCPQTVNDIVAKIRQMPRRPVLAILDNLSELKPRGNHRNGWDATAEILGDLRLARKQLGIPILTLAHPNREATKGVTQRKLRMQDIGGGGAAERRCDGILILHREDIHPTRDHKKDPPVPDILEVYAPKFRGIGTGFCELQSIPHEHRFGDVWKADEWREASVPTTTTDSGEGLPMAPMPGELGYDPSMGDPW